MNLENLLNQLLKQGKVKRQAAEISALNGYLSAAAQNFAAAKFNLSGGYSGTAFKSAYDGVLLLSRVVLLLNGYRTNDGEQHKTTFIVAGALLGPEFGELIGLIDRCRIKRNNLVYQPLAAISKSEAENILLTAEEYWHKVKQYLKSKNRQLELFDM